MHVKCAAHRNVMNFIKPEGYSTKNTDKEAQQFLILRLQFTSSLMDPNIVPCTLFSSVLEDTTSHSYEKKGKIMLMNSPRYSVLYGVKEGARVAQLVATLRYKGEIRGFDSRWCQWNSSLTVLQVALWPSGRLRL